MKFVVRQNYELTLCEVCVDNRDRLVSCVEGEVVEGGKGRQYQFLTPCQALVLQYRRQQTQAGAGACQQWTHSGMYRDIGQHADQLSRGRKVWVLM